MMDKDDYGSRCVFTLSLGEVMDLVASDAHLYESRLVQGYGEAHFDGYGGRLKTTLICAETRALEHLVIEAQEQKCKYVVGVSVSVTTIDHYMGVLYVGTGLVLKSELTKSSPVPE